MLLHNIKQSIRGMLKNKTYTFLNIKGFAVGFAVVIIIMLFAYREYSMDSSFPNSSNIYRLIDTEKQSVGIDSDIAPYLEKFPNVKNATPLFYANFSDEGFREFLLDVETGNSIETKEPFISTTNNFFSLFGIKTLVCKAEQPFADVKSIVLTRSVAMQLYGKIDVLDKVIKKEDALFTVSAVVEDMPENSSIKAGVFISDNNPDYVLAVNTLGGVKYYPRNIFVKLDKDANIKDFINTLNANFPKNKSQTKSVKLQALEDIYLSNPLEDDHTRKGSVSLIWVFITIAILTLIMSIFNYANFMISRQMVTLKNSGIRITNGALRGQIRSYYFTEVSLAVVVAFAFALLIAQLAMPYVEQLLQIKLGLCWLLEPKLLAVFMVLFISVVILSAIAPIIFISRLKVQTLFGKTNIKSRKHPVKRAMNIAQLAISMMLLVAVFSVNKQLDFVKTTDIGFNTSHLLRLNIPWDYENYSLMKEEFSKLPFVESSSLTSNTPGSGWSRTEMQNKSGEDVLIHIIGVDDDFLQTFGMQLKQGREFRKTEANKGVFYFTEYAYKTMGWETLEDIKLKNNGKVVGVVNDLYYNSLHNAMVPVAFFYSNQFYSGLNLRLIPGNLSEQMEAIQKLWKKIFKKEPFSFNFYDQYFDSLYKKEERQAQAITIFAIIAFIITCLGLLSQVLQNTQNRIKEIGIRKINGASIKEVMLLLNKEFLWTVVIAFIIATPIAYYAMSKWLENFAYKTALSWWIFALAGLSALVIALLTVSWQSYRAASRNPVEALRYE